MSQAILDYSGANQIKIITKILKITWKLSVTRLKEG